MAPRGRGRAPRKRSPSRSRRSCEDRCAAPCLRRLRDPRVPPMRPSTRRTATRSTCRAWATRDVTRTMSSTSSGSSAWPRRWWRRCCRRLQARPCSVLLKIMFFGPLLGCREAMPALPAHVVACQEDHFFGPVHRAFDLGAYHRAVLSPDAAGYGETFLGALEALACGSLDTARVRVSASAVRRRWWRAGLLCRAAIRARASMKSSALQPAVVEVAWTVQCRPPSVVAKSRL